VNNTYEPGGGCYVRVVVVIPTSGSKLSLRCLPRIPNGEPQGLRTCAWRPRGISSSELVDIQGGSRCDVEFLLVGWTEYHRIKPNAGNGFTLLTWPGDHPLISKSSAKISTDAQIYINSPHLFVLDPFQSLFFRVIWIVIEWRRNSTFLSVFKVAAQIFWHPILGVQGLTQLPALQTLSTTATTNPQPVESSERSKWVSPFPCDVLAHPYMQRRVCSSVYGIDTRDMPQRC
jgi:hypothetical protein